jgi:hypothetical protein
MKSRTMKKIAAAAEEDFFLKTHKNKTRLHETETFVRQAML